jgi:endo-1,4-beta-xylanase
MTATTSTTATTIRRSRSRDLVLGLLVPVFAGSCLIQKATPTPESGNTGAVTSPVADLRPAAEAAHRRVGTALMSTRLDDSRVRTLVAHNFDSLTPENEMKWETIEPAPGMFAWAGADKLVAFAAANGIRMRGHTLVWHSQLASWARRLPPAELRAAMVRHVRTVAARYHGKIAAWDVVNEALADGPSGQLRDDSPFTALGPSFIDEAFRAAHEADPDAQLFYNDYEIEGGGSPKSEAAFALCKRLVGAGVPISGVGLQMHVDPRHWPSAASIQRNMERYAGLGLRIEITEMDVPVGEIPGTLDQKLERQRAIAHDIVAACVSVERCAAITFWGLTDHDSWLEDPHWGALRGRGPHRALLFDGAYRPKPMVLGVLDALGGR